MATILTLTERTTNILLSVAAVFLIVAVFVVEHAVLKRKEERWQKWVFMITYIVDFILVLAVVFYLLWLWGFDYENYISERGAEIKDLLFRNIGSIISSLLILFVSLFLIRISRFSLGRIGRKEGPLQRRKQTISRIAMSITKYVIWILTILLILSIWGINVVPALAGLGVIGLVIGLGAQGFIHDLISGFFIIFEQHFDVGDRIEVQGFKGDVIDLGLKTTRIKNWKGEVRILNNGDITSVTNFSRNPSLAVADFSIAYETDVRKAIEILNRELPKLREEHPEMLEDPYVPGVMGLGESGVDLSAFCKTENEQHYGTVQAMLLRIKEILDLNGIEIPFPQVVVSQKKADE
ncbi:MAG: mechanosensitive ion channel family protein [Acholeplasmataceae bacterium]